MSWKILYKTEAVNLNLILFPFRFREDFEKEKFKSIFCFKWEFAVVIFFEFFLKKRNEVENWDNLQVFENGVKS